MSTVDYRKVPIPTGTLPIPCPDGSDRELGNDAGYRGDGDQPIVTVCESFTPIVLLDERIKRELVYAVGGRSPICMYYPNGLGAPNVAMVREPLNAMLLRANELLAAYDREVLLVDLLRLTETQRRLWCYLMYKLMGSEKPLEEISLWELVTKGCAADDVGAYANVHIDQQFGKLEAGLYAFVGPEVEEIARRLGKTYEEVSELIIIFKKNLDPTVKVEFDKKLTTAHGTGGAPDAMLLQKSSGKPVNLGVPFDYTSPTGRKVAWMRYFENPANLEDYQAAVAEDPVLQEFLAWFGITEVTREVFGAIRDERRMFCHAMMVAGFSWFHMECWHFDGGDPNHPQWPGAGSTCHSLNLSPPPLDDDGRVVGIWGNEFAQREVARLKAGIKAELDAAEALDNKCAVLAEHMGADTDPYQRSRDAILGEGKTLS